jgi:glycosyltransferase involved in cell wall biosynthesis
VIVTFVYPSSPVYTGGVVVLYHYANGLAARGHEVHFVHGPTTPMRIASVAELDWFPFDERIAHHVVDVLDDPSLPDGDVVFSLEAPPRLGQPVILIQGYKMIAAAVERPAYRARCPKLIVASWLRDVGVAWGSPPEQLLYTPMGLDHDVFRVVSAPDERPVDVALLWNVHPVKGWDDAMAALEVVREGRPDLRVEAFGMVPPTEPLAPWVHLRIDPGRDALATEVLNRAKVFLQPSRREGFGYAAVEAMACGAALVTTDNGGSRDYAIPDRTAVVVGRRDVAAMASAVAGLLDDDDRRARLARAGAEHVRRFTWEEGAAAMEAHLERYLADPAALQKPPGDAPMFMEDDL